MDKSSIIMDKFCIALLISWRVCHGKIEMALIYPWLLDSQMFNARHLAGHSAAERTGGIPSALDPFSHGQKWGDEAWSLKLENIAGFNGWNIC